MSLQLRLALQGNLQKYAEQTKVKFLVGARDARDIMGTRLKLALRDDVRRAGLGDRLANTWQYIGYPKGAQLAYHPAGIVYSKAPLIVESFSADTTIVAKKGIYLAIPTENVPRRGRAGGQRGQGGRLSVAEVEAVYGQKLTILPGKGGGLTGPGAQFNTLLGCVDKTFNRRQRRDRARKKGPRGVLPRTERPFLTVMFVFVKQVHLNKRLNWQQIAKDAQGQWERIMATEIARQLAA